MVESGAFEIRSNRQKLHQIYIFFILFWLNKDAFICIIIVRLPFLCYKSCWVAGIGQWLIIANKCVCILGACVYVGRGGAAESTCPGARYVIIRLWFCIILRWPAARWPDAQRSLATFSTGPLHSRNTFFGAELHVGPFFLHLIRNKITLTQCKQSHICEMF